jgi:diguanylate cyclase (GGDEF)-like protein
MLSDFWKECLIKLEHAFQPIVNPFSGVTFAVEALLRNYEQCGFETIAEFFDRAFRENVLFDVDIELRRKAMQKFKTIEGHKKMKLFYNYDIRIVTMPGFVKGRTKALLISNGIEPDSFCFEISERHKHSFIKNTKSIFDNVKQYGCRLAIDDFGAGFANFELFYYSEPNFLKIDKFLIQNIDEDIKKKKYCSNLTGLAHFFGITIIAEGVETKKEFLACKELGFDLIQGFFIARPALNVADVLSSYSSIQEIDFSDKRDLSEDAYLISNEMVSLKPVNINDSAETVLSNMRDHMKIPVVPVVDETDIPLGIISEKTLKEYLYMPYGKELLHNRSLTVNIRKFISTCPIVEINIAIEKILELFVANKDAEGVIITKGLKYYGFLTAQSLLNTLNEKNLAFARDMNPLTKLPGNNLINGYLNQAFRDEISKYFLIYFDFDNFKPFNDRFGFRQGDRAIILFSDILKKDFSGKNEFIGHIGGDDFFGGMLCNDQACQIAVEKVKKAIHKFTESVISFYSPSEVDKGFYRGKDRNGVESTFPLLTISAAVIELPIGKREHTPDEISNILAELKKKAKASDEKIAVATMNQALAYTGF